MDIQKNQGEFLLFASPLLGKKSPSGLGDFVSKAKMSAGHAVEFLDL